LVPIPEAADGEPEAEADGGLLLELHAPDQDGRDRGPGPAAALRRVDIASLP